MCWCCAERQTHTHTRTAHCDTAQKSTIAQASIEAHNVNVLPPHCHRLAAARGVHHSSPRCIADKFRWVFSATTCMHKYSNTSGKGTHVDISYRPTHTHTHSPKFGVGGVVLEVWINVFRNCAKIFRSLALSRSLSLCPYFVVCLLCLRLCPDQQKDADVCHSTQVVTRRIEATAPRPHTSPTNICAKVQTTFIVQIYPEYFDICQPQRYEVDTHTHKHTLVLHYVRV